MPRRTKIVATLGPSTSSPEAIASLIRAGLDVARLNFSHGTHDDHRRFMALVRKAAEEEGRTVAILQDLAGPKIRLGALPEGGVNLESGQMISLYPGNEPKGRGLPVNYPYLLEDVTEGERILLADGLVEMKVKKVTSDEAICQVLVGGVVTSFKGINLPVSNLRVPAFTEKDRLDLKVGLEEGVDFVALSFVRHEDDLKEARAMLNESEDPPLLIVKIEKPQAVDRLPQILEAVDGVMVARGDLGVEMALEKVPLIQKRIIQMARSEGKPVITATQMLRSMMDSPRPTRAEAADVANAILDGSDAVMLSDESAVGNYAPEAVAMLDRIAKATEPAFAGRFLVEERESSLVPVTEGNISRAAVRLAYDLEAAAIVASTTSGGTARLVSRFRSLRPVLALTPRDRVHRQLCLSWGVIPVLTPELQDTDDMMQLARDEAARRGLAGKGDRLVITAGVPMGVPGTTNLIKVINID